MNIEVRALVLAALAGSIAAEPQNIRSKICGGKVKQRTCISLQSARWRRKEWNGAGFLPGARFSSPHGFALDTIFSHARRLRFFRTLSIASECSESERKETKGDG